MRSLASTNFASFKKAISRGVARFTGASAIPALVALVTIGNAPLQCGREPDPALRREDTPGDALWELAAAFRAKGDARSAVETLRFLVDRYPSSRFAPAAKEQLRLARDGGADEGGASSF
jgi:hypothetical protein